MKVAIIFTSLFLLVLIWSCAKEITPAPSVTHPADWASPKSTEFHGNKAKAVGYESCITCHGTDYLGGSSGTSCYKCHDETKGMEACNLCHGNSEASILDIASWAPPEDLSGDRDSTAIGVGAHQAHLKGTSWSTAYSRDCNLCHPAMAGFNDPHHIDLQAGVEIKFGETATWYGAVNPEWDQNTATCNNVYCHGNFAFNKSESANPWAYESQFIMGNNQEMDWTEVGTGQADCETCHSLPPMGHLDVEVTCNNCHATVVDANNQIIDKSKHINGRIDLN